MVLPHEQLFSREDSSALLAPPGSTGLFIKSRQDFVALPIDGVCPVYVLASSDLKALEMGFRKDLDRVRVLELPVFPRPWAGYEGGGAAPAGDHAVESTVSGEPPPLCLRCRQRLQQSEQVGHCILRKFV